MEAFERLPPLDIMFEQLWPEPAIHANLRVSGRPPAVARDKSDIRSLSVKSHYRTLIAPYKPSILF